MHKGDVRPDHRSLDDVTDLLNSDVAMGRALMCVSRNDWVAGILMHIAPDFGISTLKFVNNIVSVLETAAINSAINEIENLLESAKRDPKHFARILHQEDTDISHALQVSNSEYDPIHGPRGEEEGDGPIYLFSYLKCLLVLFRYAQEKDLCIMHVRHAH